MSESPFKGSPRSSFPHQDRKLRAQNSLYQKTSPVRESFEPNRCALRAKELAQHGMSEAERRREALAYYKAQREGAGRKNKDRGSKMVRDAHTKLILKPPLNVGLAVDAAAHRARLSQERHRTEQIMEKEYDSNAHVSTKSLTKDLYKAARYKITPRRRSKKQHHSH